MQLYITLLDRDERGLISSRGGELYPRHRLQTGSRVHKASHPMCTGSSLAGGKAAGA
jgi:hypothetical protein